jgi:hypothetical protein
MLASTEASERAVRVAVARDPIILGPFTQILRDLHFGLV